MNENNLIKVNRKIYVRLMRKLYREHWEYNDNIVTTVNRAVAQTIVEDELIAQAHYRKGVPVSYEISKALKEKLDSAETGEATTKALQ